MLTLLTLPTITALLVDYHRAAPVTPLLVPHKHISRRPPLQMSATAETLGLHDAAADGDAGMVELMLVSGLPVNLPNARGSTPLHFASLKGNVDIVALLLDHGADANAPNAGGNSPLHAAVETGQLQVTKLLLARGGDGDAVSDGGSGAPPLLTALRRGDVEMVLALLDGGAHLDDESVQAAFWLAVQLVESAPEGSPPAVEAPRLLHHVFEADMRHLLRRERVATNVTCMQPVEEGTGYDLVNEELVQVPLRPGRACDGGACCDACSRVSLPSFATAAEADAFRAEVEFVITPPTEQFSLQKCVFRDTRTALIFVRLVERMRRMIAHEYGLPLSTVLPMQAFAAMFTGENAKQATTHSDESTHKEFHYSCVAYFTDHGDDFEGGTFYWKDAAEAATDEEGGVDGGEEGSSRVLTPRAPSKGSAVIFSSGWENLHQVEPLRSGTRLAIPAFFTTCPVPPELLEPPADDAAIARSLHSGLLEPEDVGAFRSFMMNWHSLLAPGHD